jgi:hypothetical protein
VQTAGVGPLVVHGAAARLGVEQMAVTSGTPRQTEDAVFKIKVVNQARFAQALGDLLGVIVLGLKWIDHAQPHQIGHLDLDRHGAAIGRTAVAQTVFVTGPSFATVYINNGNRRSHGADYPRIPVMDCQLV